MFEQPPVIAVPPPPVLVAKQEATTNLVRFRPGTARCAGIGVPFARRVDPFVVVAQRFPSQDGVKPADVTLRFRVDADGRPLSIARVSPAGGPQTYYVDTSDLEPSLAASRMAPGPRDGCEVTFAAEATPLEDADDELLIEAVASPATHAYWPRLYDRLAPAGSDCVFGRLRPRVLVNPDLRRFEKEAERRGAVFAFDVGADARPRNVRALHNGDPAIAREVEASVKATRFFPVTPMQACVIGYFVGGLQPDGEQLSLPPKAASASKDCLAFSAPGREPFRPGPFPENFERRNVEGYAILRYDIATWGEAGNIRVEASEPAAAFGERASAALRDREFLPSPEGRTGCTVRVVYRLGE